MRKYLAKDVAVIAPQTMMRVLIGGRLGESSGGLKQPC